MTNKFSARLDSADTVFFERELEHIASETYDVQYPDLKARQIFPVSFEADPGADTLTYYQFDKVGSAKVIGNYADDLPSVDVKGKRFTQPVFPIAGKYHYSIQEIRAARMAGRSLESMRADAAKYAVMKKENDIAFLGEATYGMLGLMNHPNIPRYTLANPGSGISWSVKTPDEILTDLNDFVHSIVITTKEVESPDTLLLPTSKYRLIAGTPRSAQSDTTILQHFLNNQEFIKEVVSVPQLAGVGVGGVDVMVAYRKDPRKLKLQIPQEFEQLEAQPNGLKYDVPVHERTAGLQVFYPLSLSIAEGL